jgi:YD repeat-containing protein
MAYDAVNRVTQTTDALGVGRRVAYDSRDNIIAITDGRGSTTTFAYDALDRQVSRTNPTGNVWRFEYDARDLRVAVIKPDGTRVAFEHDSRARLVSAGVAGDAGSQRLYGYGGFSQGGRELTNSSAHLCGPRDWRRATGFAMRPCRKGLIAAQYTTALSATCAGEPVSACALPRASSQPSSRFRRATICSVGDAAMCAGLATEKAIVFDFPSLLICVFAVRRCAFS